MGRASGWPTLDRGLDRGGARSAGESIPNATTSGLPHRWPVPASSAIGGSTLRPSALVARSFEALARTWVSCAMAVQLHYRLVPNPTGRSANETDAM
ncbi:hypothetical protein [Rhodococcus triatomae]